MGLEDLQTPKERLLNLATMNPDQCVAVAIVGQEIKITYGFNTTRELVAMLNALEDELKKTVQLKPFQKLNLKQ